MVQTQKFPDWVVTPQMFGAKADGSTDDTAAIDRAIAALPSLPGSFSAATYRLHFPAGRYITQGGHVIPSDKRVTITGDGPYQSILYRKSGSANDMLTINSLKSGIIGLALNGGFAGPGTGDGIVINAGNVFLENVDVYNQPGDAVAIGKASGAINPLLFNVNVRFAGGYGINIYAGNNTDGYFAGVNVGNVGKSGIIINAGAQLMSGVHVWGTGLYDNADNSGFYVKSGMNTFSSCEAETCNGKGFDIRSVVGNALVGCSVWGNLLAGVYAFNCRSLNISGSFFKNNGASNSAGSTSAAFSSLELENSTENSICGNSSWDDGQIISAGSYGSVSPTYPYPGRSAVFTLAYHYSELGTSDANIITGNSFPVARTRTNLSYLIVGNKNRIINNAEGYSALRTVASASTVTLPNQADIIDVTGTTAITTITASYAGRRVTLVFSNAAPGQVTDGSNLKLAGNFTPSQNSTISLVCDGTNWIETSRSVN